VEDKWCAFALVKWFELAVHVFSSFLTGFMLRLPNIGIGLLLPSHSDPSARHGKADHSASRTSLDTHQERHLQS
jgi:hypothetical protein